jgi:hypothetical protein
MKIRTLQNRGLTSGCSYCKKQLLLIFLFSSACFSIHSQIAVAKIIGKNAKYSHIGGELFLFYSYPINEIGNRLAVLELGDFAYFEPKSSDSAYINGYISIKAGFRYIFSEETATGFYIEPQIGYAQVDRNTSAEPGHGGGVAIAAIGGYNFEVGKRRNSLNLGLKYETDLAGSNYTMSSLSLRFFYSFGLFRRKTED